MIGFVKEWNGLYYLETLSKSFVSFHCETYELAKHKRSIYVIHSDIWGPSLVPNICRARWFVSFINDFTRVFGSFYLNTNLISVLFS